MKTKLYCFFHFSQKKREQFLFLQNPQKSAVSSTYTTFLRITKKTNNIDISLTGTHYCVILNFPTKNKFTIIFNISEENCNPTVVSWKEYAFTLKVVYAKLL